MLRNIRATDNSLWHLLTMTGYLKAQFAGMTTDNRRQMYHLAVPNLQTSLFWPKNEAFFLDTLWPISPAITLFLDLTY